ncbi:MAG: hypothetical protein CR982_01225 [Candidatus Cloacimonadota bacterium]|nr:MAG: hypothetical protein CR982_01225 [Candidatus Cloacimonadota bacterium]PIE81266.1 MAG: hypothetical protein CSA15_01005 [Candidatus Delongbacteria bacterium]
MEQYLATTVFGLESVLKNEISKLGYRIIKTEDGRVIYEGDEKTGCRSSMFLRTASRIFKILMEIDCDNFDTFFDSVKKLPWNDIIRKDRTIITKARSRESKLSSTPVLQAMGKKAIVSQIIEKRDLSKLYEGDGEKEVTIEFSIIKNRLQVLLDIGGKSLHKRGYRTEKGLAPLRENLAAGICQLSYHKNIENVIDPFCGSGTLLIEYCMMKKRMAPGLLTKKANFISDYITLSQYREVYDEAKSYIIDIDEFYYGHDIDPKTLTACKNNIVRAGLDEDIIISRKDFMKYNIKNENNLILSNPPYGKRIGETKDLLKLYGKLEEMTTYSKNLKFSILTSYENFRPDKNKIKNRKLYNGKIKSYLYTSK